MRTYTADEVDEMIGRALARERERVAQQQEPVLWQILNGVCHAGVRSTENLAKEAAAGMQKTHDLGGSLAAFHVRPLYTSPQPAQRKPLTDDPLQGAVDWLLEADGEYFCTATVQRTLRIGYNRAKRLCDTAKERAAHGIKGDA